MPPSLEERVAFLEGKLDEHSRGFGEIRELLLHLNGRVDSVNQKMDRFRGDLSSRIDALDQKLDRFREELGSRIDALDQKADLFRQEVARQFHWLVSIQVAILLSIVAALLGR